MLLALVAVVPLWMTPIPDQDHSEFLGNDYEETDEETEGDDAIDGVGFGASGS